MANWRERLALALIPKESRALTANDAVRGLWSGVQTSTGLRVDEKTSLQVIAVFNAIKILSEGFAQIPLKLYRRENNARVEVRDHNLYKLLHEAPNDRIAAFNMHEHWMMSLGLWGNSYTQIIRNMREEIVELWPLHPGFTKPTRTSDGRIFYRCTVNSDPTGHNPSTEEVVLREDEVLHIRGLSLDGFMGISPIQMIRENIGLADAYTQFAGKFFANDAMDFALFTERVMQQPQLEEMHKEWSEKHGGLNKHRLAIFHGGLKPEKIGMPLDDAQFLEQRAFSREEIFSFYRIPPNFYAADKVSSWGTGIEQMQIGFIKFTLDPWFVRAEQALNLKFLNANAQGALYAEFDREGFLRGDFKTRIQGYKDLFNMGVISNVGIARIENMKAPPTEVWLVPSNMTPVDKIDAIADKAAKPDPAPVIAPPGEKPALTAPKPAAKPRTATDPGKFVRSYMDTFKHRQDTDPQPLEREIVRGGNAFLYAAYRATGVTEMIWVAGDDCDKCMELDGQTRTFEDKHPPICDECRCIVLPAGETRTESGVSPITINNYQPPVTVPVTVEPAQVKIEQAAQEPPVVNMPAYEQQPAPIINVNVEPTPVTVRNDVKTPEVHIKNEVDASPKGDITLEYDEAQGRLKSLKRKKT